MLKLSFVPHVYTDVYWFGTGFSFDSPYGEWRANGEAPPVSWEDKDYTGTTMTGAGGSHDTPIAAYRPLVVNPPVKTIGGLSGFGCIASGADGSQICTPLQGGTYTPVFNFDDTYGYFYWRYKNLNNNIGDGDNIPLLTFTTTGDPSYIPYYGPAGYDYHQDGITLGSTYKLIVPQQSILCPITVQPPIGSPPAKPTLSSGACVVDTPHTLSMVSSDPDDDQLRYGIDWDANGVVDQWVPPSGYVDSGTSQTASRTYAIPGSKTVKALAQDMNGNTSSWASISFSCSGSATVGLHEGDGEGGGGSGDGDPLALLPDLDLRVIPSLVKSGNTTKVNWSSDNVRSCSVAGENGDSWSGLLSPLGGLTSQPITSETIYTLSCLDLGGGTLTKSATVRIIPTFQEK